MDLTITVTTQLLLLSAAVLGVAAVRVIELQLSRRRQAALRARGAQPVVEPHFRSMVLLHAGVLVVGLLEAWVRARPPALGASLLLLAVLVASNGLRWWVIATLGPHWNVQVMASLPLGVVSRGPFRFVRHPNYVAVFVELIALPLLGGAWLTALVGAVAHGWVLYHRVRCEEGMLMNDPAYRAAMAHKARFVPGLL